MIRLILNQLFVLLLFLIVNIGCESEHVNIVELTQAHHKIHFIQKYNNRVVKSPIGRKIQDALINCRKDVVHTFKLPNFGMGSDLHIYSQGMYL
jgi:hypothetical protein